MDRRSEVPRLKCQTRHSGVSVLGQSVDGESGGGNWLGPQEKGERDPT